MDQIQIAAVDVHLKKNFSSHCRLHPTQAPKYYCSDPSCRTSLCLICIKTHPKKHLPNLATIKDVKSQTFDILKKETMTRFDALLNSLLKSNKMDDLFKETFGNLMQQNTTVNLDDEDIADILADTLQRKYFEKGVMMTERIQKETSVKLSSKGLIAFDYEFDYGADTNHQINAQRFCHSSSEYYCNEELGSFYMKSKGQVVFWNCQDQTLLCKDVITFKSKKYNVPTYFQFLTVLESEEGVLFVVESDERLIVYSIETEDDSSLKLRHEFPLEEEEEIVFLVSDHVNHLFTVTIGEGGLRANLYALRSQDNGGLELLKLTSFQSFDHPKKAVFDRLNNLFFILGESFLEVYKYRVMPTALLQRIFKVKTTDFEWHQATQRLFLLSSGKLYQSDKGKFRLIKSIDKSNSPIALTDQGVLCLANGMFLLSLKNPNQRKDLTLPSVAPEMECLQEKSRDYLADDGFEHDVEPKYGELQTFWQAAKVIAETPDHLLIFANVTSYQSASQKVEYDSWSSFGGTIYSKYLLRYDLSQEKFQVLE